MYYWVLCVWSCTSNTKWMKACIKTTFIEFSQWFNVNFTCTLPVDCYCAHGVNARKHWGDGEKVVEFAVGFSKIPITVRGINKINQSVESGHRCVWKRQVEQKVIGDGSHPLVSQNDPHDDQIPEHRDRQDGAVRHRPERDAPRRLHELVCKVPS